MTISPVYEKSTKRVIANGSKSCIVTSFLVFSIRSSERNKVFYVLLLFFIRTELGSSFRSHLAFVEMRLLLAIPL